MEKELGDMEKAIESLDSTYEEPRTDPPGTEAPGTESPGTEAPGTDSPATEAPGTESPSTDAPSTDIPPEDPRDKELRELREEIDELKKPKPEPTEAPPTKAPSTDIPIGEEDFLGDVDLDELTRDPKSFNQVLNKIYKKAREDARLDIRQSGESVVRSIPDIVKNNITITSKLQEAQKKFYEDNEDLVPWKTAVATVFQEKMTEDPGKRYDEILPEVAVEARRRIGLGKEIDNKGKEDKPPKLPGKGKSGPRTPTKPDLTTFEKELNDMDKALDNF